MNPDIAINGVISSKAWVRALVFGVAAITLFAGIWLMNAHVDTPDSDPNQATLILPTFESCQDLRTALNDAAGKQSNRFNFESGSMRSLGTLSLDSTLAPTSAPEYSTTNIQVAGVDEADIVKNDGRDIFSLYDGRLTITRAYPPERAAVLSTIDRSEIMPTEMFLAKDRLVLIGSRYVYADATGDKVDSQEVEPGTSRDIAPQGIGAVSVVEIWDVDDRAHPVKLRTTEVEGASVAARMIDDDVYLVTTSPASVTTNGVRLPMMRDSENPEPPADLTGFVEAAPCTQVAHFDPIVRSNFITVASISVRDANQKTTTQVTVGSGENVYASLENLYVAETSYSELATDVVDTWNNGKQETTIYQFALNRGEVTYQHNATVPGVVLNQYSMDEDKGYFRIATTEGSVSRSGESNANNHVTILDADFDRVGAVENIAPGERIYSVRFMGARGYVVTFKKVDPLFALDLSDSQNPRILGQLKIPGYSDYLHPYDETHLIGIGKDTVEGDGGNFAWYQGLKLAVFDVTDPTRPEQLHQEIIGDRGTDSPVLRDPKALLFDRERGLFVIPVSLAEIPDVEKFQGSAPVFGSPAYGDYTFQGAYVYRLTLDRGFEFRGRITHARDEATPADLGSLALSGADAIERSLYIGDALYTISGSAIHIHALSDLSELKRVFLDQPNIPL